MSQNIICHKGKCKDTESIRTRLEEVYGSSDMEDKIQFDMIKKSIRKKDY